MNALLGLTRRAVLPLLLLATPGCVSLGNAVDGYGSGRNVRGRIVDIDERRREIDIRDSYGGARVYYDNRTDVVYGNRRYSVRALERGDRVTVRVRRESRRNVAYAERILVERSGGSGGVYDRDRRRDRIDDRDRRVRRESFVGVVGRVDHGRGAFDLRVSRGRVYRVTLPRNPRSADAKRFRRLRSGNRVRVEGVLVGRERIELYRFR